MELFHSKDIESGRVVLSEEEAAHCVKVLRHRCGDVICVMDGKGTMLRCRIDEASPKAVAATVLESFEGWGGHPYRLTLGVCPTKNNDRFEWFVEKAVEMGVDRIVPLIGERSERKVYKTDRAVRVALSAAKQSLKAAVPEISEAVPVAEFISKCTGSNALKLIAYCFEGEVPRVSVKSALDSFPGNEIVVLIGPEGDFSPAEAGAAVEAGFVPVHLGASRLRTETAAVVAAAAVYFKFM